jgi:hypothetical protein
MLDVIDLFREHETRDELGIGSVRDAFADLLFPGTSTIMTRARYFLIVPWLYQRLEARRVSSAEVAAKARAAELDLIEVIGRSSDHDGQIGKRAKRRLKRLPSSVYWQGLGVWGIERILVIRRSITEHWIGTTRFSPIHRSRALDVIASMMTSSHRTGTADWFLLNVSFRRNAL